MNIYRLRWCLANGFPNQSLSRKHQHLVLPWPGRKAKSCQPHLRPKVHVTSWSKASSCFSFRCHWKLEGPICPFPVMHDWPFISYGLLTRVRCLGFIHFMFGDVWSCFTGGCNFFSKYLFFNQFECKFDRPTQNPPAQSPFVWAVPSCC